MAFKQLISDLTGLADKKAAPLAKSNPGDAGDAAIQAAGETGGDSGDGGEGSAAAGDGAGDGAGGDTVAGGDGSAADGSEGGDGDDMSKSFEVTLEDGSKFKAVDASTLLKALNDRVEDVETSAGQALGLCVDMIKSLVASNAALEARVAKMAGSGTGRVAVLSVVGKGANAGTPSGTPLIKSEDKGMKPHEFLAKAEAAFDAGKLPGKDMSLIETYINRAEPIPQNLIQKVMSASGAVSA